MYNITSFNSLSQFRFDNPYIASYLYNYANGVLSIVNDVTNTFVATMKDLYLSQLLQTKLIVYVCAGVVCFLVMLQLPFAYVINSTIDSQAGLFLRIPTKHCRTEQQRVDVFLEQLKAPT
ncbi:MAG: hypothetical protein P4M11_03620 [Candidatus Pacebacteria bacterium]|nr:hypothetical protein [Candidatus Paceibacterota bacterium]